MVAKDIGTKTVRKQLGREKKESKCRTRTAISRKKCFENQSLSQRQF